VFFTGCWVHFKVQFRQRLTWKHWTKKRRKITKVNLPEMGDFKLHK
jgi:hypothetical protein